ncbi:MAG TPA: hypothetical protein VJ761_02525, partial [Ktedonobacteraceae bacterium]|nr:hypothetical protein [Ktedonobacteraceae bacterium]
SPRRGDLQARPPEEVASSRRGDLQGRPKPPAPRPACWFLASDGSDCRHAERSAAGDPEGIG